MAGEVGIPEFSYKQVRRLFANTPGDMRRVIADGQRVAFETACLVSRRKHGRVANRLWELDVTELEVWALNTATGRLFRPWMTSVIDVGHRIIMAAVIHHKEPSTADALAVLEEAMLPKKSVDYPFYGQPKAIRCDNASIYQSAEWLAALMRLGITPDPIPDRCPSANGIIERSFLTFKSGLFCRLAGYTDQYRGLAIAQKRGAIPAPLLPGIVRKFIVGEYHLRKHDALKTTPWESWHEHLDVAEGLIINPDEIREALKLRRTRTVQRDGIEYNGRLFTGECLHGLVNEDVTILVSPSGKDDALTVYLAKNLIGKVTCQDDDPAAVEAINKTRLDRTIEIQRFAKSMRGTVPTDPDATPVVPTVPKGAGEPTPVPQTQEDESELPLGRIPEFSPEE